MYPLGLKASEYRILAEWRDHPSYEIFRQILEVYSMRDNDALLSVQPADDSNYLRGKIAGFVEAYETVATLIHTVEEHNARKRSTDADRADIQRSVAGNAAGAQWGSATHRAGQPY